MSITISASSGTVACFVGDDVVDGVGVAATDDTTDEDGDDKDGKEGDGEAASGSAAAEAEAEAADAADADADGVVGMGWDHFALAVR